MSVEGKGRGAKDKEETKREFGNRLWDRDLSDEKIKRKGSGTAIGTEGGVILLHRGP